MSYSTGPERVFVLNEHSTRETTGNKKGPGRALSQLRYNLYQITQSRPSRIQPGPRECVLNEHSTRETTGNKKGPRRALSQLRYNL